MKSNKELIQEVAQLRKRVSELEESLAHKNPVYDHTREALVESEKKYRSLVDSSIDLIFSYNTSGILTYVSPAAHSYGYKPEEVIGTNVFAYIPEEDVPAVQHYFEMRIREGKEFPLQLRFKTSDGQIRHVELSSRIMRDSDGTVTEVKAFAHDITQQVKAQEAERTANLELKTLIESLPGYVFFKDRNRCYRVANRAFCRVMDRDWQDITGKRDEDILPSSKAQKYCAEDMLILSGEKDFIETEETIEVEGKSISVITKKVPVRDNDGTITGLIAIAFDITDKKKALEDLSFQLKFTETLINAIPSSVYYKNSEGIYIECNEAFCRNQGMSRDKIIGKTVLEVIRKKEAEEHHRQDLQLLEKGGNARYELKFFSHILKEERDGWFIKSVFHDTAGKRSGVIGIMIDVTEQKKLEEALKESEERFALFMDNFPGCAFIKNSEKKYIYVNRGYEAYFGIMREDWLNRSSEEMWPGQTAHHAGTLEDRVIAGEIVEDVTDRPQKGETHTWYTVRFPIPQNRGHACIGGFSLDVTERKIAEELMREKEEKLSIITSAANDAIIMMNNEGSVTFWNPSAEKIFGYTREEAMGRNLHILLASRGHLERFFTAFPRWVETGTGAMMGKTIELPAIRKDGSEVHVEMSLSSVRIRENYHAIGLIRDVSERRRQHEQLIKTKEEAETARTELETALEHARLLAREATRADLAKSQFLTNMSHELRTPMNAIIGLTELVLTTDLTLQQREELTMVSEAAAGLLKLLNDLLNSSKLVAGKMLLETMQFHLKEEVEVPVKLLIPRAQKKGLSLSLEYDENLPASVIGDPSRLRQILTNIIDNALKFTEKGTVEVRVSLLEGQKESAVIAFDIHDSGIGIPIELHRKIFEPFEQADGSTTRRYGGTGLGLNITKHLVELMKGTIEVSSEPGRGSTFHIIIPFAIETRQESSPRTSAQKPESIRKASQCLTILLAEDEIINQEYATRLLERRGHRVVRVENGIEVLKALEGGSFDLILMDVQMPHMDGLETSRAIRDREKGGKGHMPIVALTAYASKSDREKCLRAGMDEYLSKPVKAAELFPLIEKIAAGLTPAAGKKRKIINSEKLALVYGGDEASIGSLVRTLLKVLPIYMVGIESAITNHEDDTLRKTAKKLRSVCAPFEIESLSMLAEGLENLPSDNDWQQAQKLQHSLRKEIENIIAEISSEEKIPRSHRTKKSVSLFKKEDLIEEQGGDSDVARSIAGTFLTVYQGYLNAIRKAILEGDPEALKKSAHRIKGSMAPFGAQKAVRKALELEMMGRNNTMDSAIKKLGELESLVECLTQELYRFTEECRER